MLRTATTERSENQTNSAKEKAAFDKAVKELKECNGLVMRGEEAKVRAVKIVNDFVKNVARGDRNKFRDALIKQAGIVRSTFFKWQSEVEEDARIGQAVIQEANRQAITINTRMRNALLEIREKQPQASPATVVQEARAAVEARTPLAPAPPLEELRNALAEHQKNSGHNVQELLRAIMDVIPKAELCNGLREVCK
jgi:hypothetical protein